MVMATGGVCQQVAGVGLPHEMGEDKEEAASKAMVLHERLVAYVHALAGGHEPRCGVWVEHSYARARGAATGPTHSVRVLLAPRPAPDSAPLDVERLEPAPPDLPDDDEALRLLADDDADGEDDDWEARLTAAAPTAAHARLADSVLDILRRARLELLAGGRAGDSVRTAARRLRLALAAPPAPPAHSAAVLRPAAWLQAQLPRGPRRLYEAALARLRRVAPRLAERVTGTQGPVASDSVLSEVGASVGEGAAGAPWLLWVSCGRPRQDERWLRRLGALIHTRLVTAGAGGAALAPEAWCGAVAGGLRAALTAALGAAGERPVVLGGLGAGATLAAALAGGTRARALVLLAPALVTAEGAREAADEAGGARLPVLVVCGAGGAQCWRGAARDVSRRVLELRGADDWLRLGADARRRRRLPQHAVDAAVAVSV